MDEKIIKNLVKNNLRIKLAQTQVKSLIPKVINFGSGVPAFKEPLKGFDFAAIMTRPLTDDDVFNTFKEILNSIKFNPNRKYTPEQTQEIIKTVRNGFIQKYSKYLDILNPQLGEIQL